MSWRRTDQPLAPPRHDSFISRLASPRLAALYKAPTRFVFHRQLLFCFDRFIFCHCRCVNESLIWFLLSTDFSKRRRCIRFPRKTTFLGSTSYRFQHKLSPTQERVQFISQRSTFSINSTKQTTPCLLSEFAAPLLRAVSPLNASSATAPFAKVISAASTAY
ncbi:hypothetical protein FOIG_07329 [Fusarium odoratissimum NRRL 54006]|uniref:Uncharacterized protein n=1 Tax=Fusarium odoratissimum (strain NRRL 54006) TaxID=1089451 RepID=X0JZL2_FUSO5|nr:uncharacterized protein FOIG_07329 [Fusarium odoratissimum NRRL 54006]EXM01882.1 hypothetical protein FOIG_07329 [Fusarium odoratissimum NRRL 54006]